MDFKEQVKQFIDSVQASAKDGLTLKEVGQTFVAGIQLFVTAATQFNAPGTDKKKIVMVAIEELYDVIAPSIPLPMFLQPFRVFLRSPIKRAVMAAADGIVEAVYAQLKGN